MKHLKLDYDTIASDYERRYARSRYPGIRKTLLSFVRPGARVLEVGCGTGHWLQELEAAGCETTGIDPSAEMLARARDRGLRTELVRGDAAALPWPDDGFDLLVAINAMHHFDEPRRFLEEARRTLCALGRIAVFGLDPVSDPGEWYVHRFWPETLELDRTRFITTEVLREELRRLGFRSAATSVAESVDDELDPDEARDRECFSRTFASQLALLDDETYAAGRIRAEASLDRGESLVCRLNIYCTTAMNAVRG